MHLGLGITFHFIAIFNACVGIYYYTIFKNFDDKPHQIKVETEQSKKRRLKHPKHEPEYKTKTIMIESDTKSRLEIVTIFFSVVLLLIGLGGMFWDLTKNTDYDYYGSPKTTNELFVAAELFIIVLQTIFALVIVYNKKFGLLELSYISNSQHNNVVGLIAVQLVFISYITLIMIYKLLQNFDLVD